MSGNAGGGGPAGTVRRLWRRVFGLTPDDPTAPARRAEEEAAREERYRRVREAEDNERFQRALIESVEHLPASDTAVILRRVMRTRREHKDYEPRPVTWAEFYAALHAERMERERGERA